MHFFFLNHIIPFFEMKQNEKRISRTTRFRSYPQLLGMNVCGGGRRGGGITFSSNINWSELRHRRRVDRGKHSQKEEAMSGNAAADAFSTNGTESRPVRDAGNQTL